MGLKDVFRRWSKSEDERALERAEEECLRRIDVVQRAHNALDKEAGEGRHQVDGG